MFRDDRRRSEGRKLWPEALKSDGAANSLSFVHKDAGPVSPKRAAFPEEVSHIVFDDFGVSPKPVERPSSPKTARVNTGSVSNPIIGTPHAGTPSPKNKGRMRTDLSPSTWASRVPLPGGVPDSEVPPSKPHGLKKTELSDKHFKGDQQEHYGNPHHYHLTKKSPAALMKAKADGATQPVWHSTFRTHTTRRRASDTAMYDVLSDPETKGRPSSAASTPRRPPRAQEISHVVFDDFGRTQRPQSAGATTRGRSNLSTFNPVSGDVVDSNANRKRVSGRGRTENSNDAFVSSVPL